MSNLFDVVKGPCLTEKSNQLQEQHGKIVLKVHPRANKIIIREAVEKLFKVKVANVRTAKVHGRQKKLGRHIGHTSDWKKAIITLSEGKINFLEEL